MDQGERLPCPVCGEGVGLAAEACPYCEAGLLVDVTLRAPVTDGRLRYRVARALQAIPGAPPLGALQNALVASPPAAARRVTRAFAHAALDALAAQGVKGGIERPPDKKAGPGAFPLRTASASVGAAVLLALAVVAWRGTAPAPSPEGPFPKSVPVPAAPLPKKAAAAPLVPLTTRELAQHSLPSAASLRCDTSVGSGFFVTPELVVTNAHVLCPSGKRLQVTLADDRKLVGEVVEAHEGVDLGLVRVVGARAVPLPVGNVADLAVGDKVMIIGSPVGLDFTVHEGSVSSLQRSAYGVAYVQLDAKISPGNSGGPVIDGFGRVVGVVSMKLAGRGVEGIGLALPINYIYDHLKFVPAPPGGEGAPAFARLVARAREESGGETRAASAGPGDGGPGDEGEREKPMLVDGSIDQYRRLVVTLLRVADSPPAFEEVEVKLWSGTQAFCSMKGDVSAWRLVDDSVPRSFQLGRLKKMLEGRSLYVGEAPLRLDLCDRTRMSGRLELELVGGSLEANRLAIR